jgi:hypothetical protein
MVIRKEIQSTKGKISIKQAVNHNKILLNHPLPWKTSSTSSSSSSSLRLVFPLPSESSELSSQSFAPPPRKPG